MPELNNTGAALFVDAIRRYGINEIFTLVGDHLNEVLQCAGERGMRIVDMRHEAAVAHAADAWARITRRPAVSLVTGGPGHTNSLTGIATAFLAGSPVITVSGCRSSLEAERNAFQDVDQLGMVRPVVKWAAQPTHAAQIPYLVGRAWTEATSGRWGPVHLTIPVDVFTSRVEKAVSYPGAVAAPGRACAVDAGYAVAMLRDAERPVIIAGSGVWWSSAEEELERFAERTRIPVYTITLGRGVMPDGHQLCFGYADPALNRGGAKALLEADVVLVVGKRMDFRLAQGGTRLFAASARLIQLDIHASEIGMNRRVDVGLCGDAKATLGAMIEAAGDEEWPERRWLERVRALRAEWDEWLDAEASDSGAPIHPAALYAELRRILPGDVLYSWDGGDFAHWGRAMLPANRRGGWLRLGPLATIGAALPNAISLQLAHPDEPVVMITGDGALGFYIAELDTCVRHKLPIVIIVGNDAGWGLERELQGGGGSVGCELRATRYDVVMQGFGGEGENIERLEQVRPAVERALASGRPYLLNVNVRGARSPFTRWKLGE